jgi:hypothetical protein
MNGADRHWLAGYLEGEGHFASKLSRGRWRRWVVTVSTVDEDVARRVHALMRGSRFYGPYAPRVAGRSPFFVVELGQNRKARAFMRWIRPCMSSRRQEQIDKALA